MPPAVSTSVNPWKDKSSRGIVPTLSGSVIYGGSTVGLHFNGGSYQFPNGTFSYGNMPINYFFVFNPSANNNNFVYTTTATGLHLRGSDMDYFQPGFDILTSVPPTNQTAFVELYYNSTLQIRTSGINTYSTIAITSTPIYNLASTSNWLGSLNGSFATTGRFSEVIMFNRSLNQYERQVIQGYLANKWNFTNYLGANHPFKSAPPNSTSLSSPLVFYPTFIPGLKLWIDGSDPTGNGYLPSNGAAVTTWRDKSGNFSNLAMTGSPTYVTNVANSNGAITFTGSQYGTVAIATGTFITALDVFVVYKFTGSAPTNTYIFDRSSAPLNSGGGTMSNTNGTVSVANNARTATYTSQFNTSLSIMNSRLSQASSGTSFYEQYSNGTLQSVVSGSPAANFTPYDSSPNFSVGAARTSTNFTGQLCEVVVYNIYLSSTQRQQIEGYLAWKWGLQTSLPSGHPYADATPSAIVFEGSQ